MLLNIKHSDDQAIKACSQAPQILGHVLSSKVRTILNNSILNQRIELMHEAVSMVEDNRHPRPSRARSLSQQNAFNRLRDLMEYLEELLFKKQAVGHERVQLCHQLSDAVFRVAIGLRNEWHLGLRQFEHLQGLHETI